METTGEITMSELEDRVTALEIKLRGAYIALIIICIAFVLSGIITVITYV